MELTRYRSFSAFHDQAEEFLVEHEAEHNLILCITTGFIKDAVPIEHEPYLATVRHEGAIVASAVRTPPHNLVISIAPLAAVELLVADVHHLYSTLPGILGPRDAARAFAEAWKQRSNQQYRLGIGQRIYQLDRVTLPEGVPGELRPATHNDYDLLLEWFTASDVELFGSVDHLRTEWTLQVFFEASTRGLYVWHDHRPVSLAGYSGPTPNGIRIGRVYTPPEFRGRGYASACVAALSQRLLSTGWRYCFLFTDLSNPTSNRIYQRIGYVPVAYVDEYVFQKQLVDTG